MNLEESNSFLEEEEIKSKKKKTIIISIIICAVIIALLFIIIVILKYQDSLILKMYINGKQVNIPSDLYIEKEGVTYVNIKEISSFLGYHYTKGDYNQYNEEETSCYLENDYEIVSLSADNTKYKKYAVASPVAENKIADLEVVVKSTNGDSQSYLLDNPIQYINGSLYVPFNHIQDMLNIQIDVSQKNKIKIYNLEYLVNRAKNILSNSNYQTISGTYENLKAILYNLVVVSDGNTYGVISLENGEEVIGLKYKEITFIQNVQEFLIMAEDTVGILAKDRKYSYQTNGI